MLLKKQQGLALLSSLILLTIITMLGFISANKNKLLHKASKTITRYEELSNAAEVSMRTAISSLIASGKPLGTEPSKVNANNYSAQIITADTALASTWDSADIQQVFSLNSTVETSGSNRTNFNDFKNIGWNSSVISRIVPRNITIPVPLQNNVLTTRYGMISTYTIVEEFMSTDSIDKTSRKTNYLITVKAGARNTQNLNDPEIENIVLQSSIDIDYMGSGLKE